MLAGRIAIITGAGRGLGREIALAYARAGASVVLTGRTLPQLRAVERELASLPCEALVCRADVTDAGQVEALVDAALGRFGHVDILVNNAGLTHGAATREIQSILDVEKDFWDELFATNCRGPFLMMKAIIPVMQKQGSGCIINITSRLSQIALPGNVPYGPSKAALEALTLGVDAEFADQGLRVNLLHPGGAVDTGIFNDHYQPYPGNVLLSPTVIGPAAVWLASDAAQDVHGQTINARTWEAPGEAQRRAT